MDRERFILEPVNENKFVRMLQVAFGILCLLVAIVWLVMNLSTYKSTGTIWITIIFLTGFSYYQIVSGLGWATKFIEYEKSEVILKANSLLPLKKINTSEIDRIDIYPLSIMFFLKSGKRSVLRFGINYTEIISPVKTGTEKFARINSIPLEYKQETL
jgi:hypothetical protein